MSPEAWDSLPEGLKRRLVSLGTSADAIAEDEKQRALAIRSGLEQWFDDTMARASGAYKRWTKWWLFGIGLLIAIVANASAFHVAERLWADPPTRSAVVSSAGQVAQQTDPSQNIPDVAHADQQARGAEAAHRLGRSEPQLVERPRRLLELAALRHAGSAGSSRDSW